MFSTDLKIGREYEKKALDLFDLSGYEEPDKENQAYYDYKLLLSNGKTRYIEVKADFKGRDTGNFALEYQCNNKPSGVNRTKADYYIIFIVGVGIYKLRPKILQSMIPKYRSVYGGDGKRALICLIPLKELESYKIHYLD